MKKTRQWISDLGQTVASVGCRLSFVLAATLALLAPNQAWAAAKEGSFAGDAMSVASGSNGSVSGFTLTRTLSKDDFKTGVSSLSGDGWYVGAKITYPQYKKGLYSDAGYTQKNNVKHTLSRTGKTITGDPADAGVDGAGLTIDAPYHAGLVKSFVRTTTWWEKFTAEELYKAGSSGITRTLKISGSVGSDAVLKESTFTISVPSTGFELYDDKGVKWFPALALGANDKVYGQFDKAFSSENTLKLAADLSYASNLTVPNGKTLNLNGKTLTVTGGTLTFAGGSRVNGAAANIVANGGAVKAEYESTFGFEPPDAWIAWSRAAGQKALKVENLGGGTWKVVYDHICDWSIAASGNTLTATCAGTGTCKYSGTKTLTLTLNVPDKTFDRNAAAPTFTDDVAATLKEASGNAITCSAIQYTGTTRAGAAYNSATVPTDAGSYTATVTVTDSAHGNAQNIVKSFTIAPATVDSVTFSPASHVFDGNAKSVTPIVKAGALTLTADEYDGDGTLNGVKGSATEDCAYSYKADGKNNFTGSKTGTWTITYPRGNAWSGSMAASSGCGVSGNTATVNNSTKLAYDKNGHWSATMTVTMPIPITKDYEFTEYGTATYYGADYVRLNVGDVVYTGAQMRDGKVPGVSATEDSGEYSHSLFGGKKQFTYFKLFTYTVTLTADQVAEAMSQGLTSLEYPITVWAVSGGNTGDDGTQIHPALVSTTYKLVVPLDANLKLKDEYGNQVYPVLPYVARIGNIKYLSLAAALDAVKAGEAVDVYAAAEQGNFTIPKNVTLNLGSFGAAGSTYVLDVDDDHLGAKIVSEKGETVTTVTGFGVVDNGHTYTAIRVHMHDWSYTSTETTIAATCANGDGKCDVGTITMTFNVTSNGDGKEPTVTFGNRDYFTDSRNGISAQIGNVSYVRPAYGAGKWYAGDYTASCVVTIGGEQFTLTKAFSITGKTAKNYTSGFAAKSNNIRFDTYAEALKYAEDGDTIYWHDQIAGRDYNFTSDKNITIDFCGLTMESSETGDVGVYNNGKGTVRLVNGTFRQAGNDKSFFFTANSGALVMGNDHSQETNPSLDDSSFRVYKTTASGINWVFNAEFTGNVFIDGGKYEFGQGNGGESLTIRGGRFLKLKASNYVKDEHNTYLVWSEDGGDNVVPHTHVWEVTKDGDSISIICNDHHHQNLCKYGTYDKHAAHKWTLSVTTPVTLSGTYSGATIQDNGGGALPSGVAPSLTYSTDDGKAPTTYGNYTVTMGYQDVGVTKSFTIYHATHSYTYTPDDEADTIAAKCTGDGPCGEGNKTYTATLSIAGKTYDGEACTATTATDDGFPGEVTLAYYLQSDRGNALEGAPTDAGDYVVVMTAGGAKVEKEFSIARKQVTVTADGKSLTYGDAELPLTATVEGTLGSDTIDYTVTRAEGTDAGSYPITVRGDDIQGNYAITWVDGATYEIAKATYDMSGVTFNGATNGYSAAEQKIEIAGDLPSGVTVSYENNVGTNAATYAATATFTGDATNYNGIEPLTATLLITQKLVTVTAVSTNKVSGAADPELTATVEGTLGGDTVAYTVTREQGEDVGEYAITVTGESSQGNYTVTFAGATFTITEPTGPSIEEGDGKLEYDETKKEAKVTEVTTKDIEVKGMPEDSTLIVPPTVASVKGVDPEKVTIKVIEPVSGNSHDITGAFKKSGDAVTGVTLALDETASVEIAGETIPVVPTLTEATAEIKPLDAGETATAVGVKTIPGLVYNLKRASEVTGVKAGAVVDTETATATATQLEDPFEGGKPDAAFYVIEVAAPAIGE